MRSVFGKLPHVLMHPAGLLSRKNYFLSTTSENVGHVHLKSEHFLKLGHFSREGSPGQTTMLTRRVSKFWVKPRFPFSEISPHDPKTLGKRLIIVSWPERRPEFPWDDDGGGGDDGGFRRTLPIWSCPGSITRRDQIFRAGNPSLRWDTSFEGVYLQRPQTATPNRDYDGLWYSSILMEFF